MTRFASSRLMRGTGPDLGPLALRLPPQERTLWHVLERQARDRPDWNWLVFDSRDRLTFAQARDGAQRFAGALSASPEYTTGENVALFLRNQVEFMPAFLGTQLMRGAAVPLNPELRGPLLQRLLAKCRARVIVAAADLLDRLEELDHLGDTRLVVACHRQGLSRPIHSVPVVDWVEWLGSARPHHPERLPQPSDVAALVFTSGTSGGSKAAVWSHHYLHLSSACVADSLDHALTDVLSTPLQMCHIAGLQVFANSALQVGCTAHLKSRFSATGYWDEIAHDGATFSMLMGQMAAMILKQVPAAPPHRLERAYILPRPQKWLEFERRYGTTVLWQGWGMTEIFPHPPRRVRLEGVTADAIGPPPGWVDFGVVDEHDQLLGPNEIGELVYRPLIPFGMASGYYDEPDATARAFRNFMFHTGDLGYHDAAGNMHFVMRNQDAIRRHGENISAVELENIALGHPAVVDAAAYAVPGAMGEHEVKLDVILSSNIALDDLHAWLVERLPRYMVPRYLQRRASFPKTPSQRVEKYKLAQEGVEHPAVRVFEPAVRRAAAS